MKLQPHDRFKNTALFLCCYLKYPEDKVGDVASQIRRYAKLNEPYELCTCQKCNTLVELEFYVTEIGCGLAGYKPKDIAPLFAECVNLKNVKLPQRFWHKLGGSNSR